MSKKRLLSGSVDVGEVQREHLRTARYLELALERQARPLLLLLEDVQWSDPETLSVIHLLLQQGNRGQVACLLTLRSEERPTTGPLADFLHGRRPPLASADDGRNALRLVQACYQSNESGKRIDLG